MVTEKGSEQAGVQILPSNAGEVETAATNKFRQIGYAPEQDSQIPKQSGATDLSSAAKIGPYPGEASGQQQTGGTKGLKDIPVDQKEGYKLSTALWERLRKALPVELGLREAQLQIEASKEYRQQGRQPEAAAAKIRIDEKTGEKVSKIGPGHVKTERPDGTSVERLENGQTYIEKHDGPKPEDKYTVTGDKSGKRIIDYGNGHTRTEFPDGKTVDRQQTGPMYEEVHDGPKPKDKFKTKGDDLGNKTTDFGGGHTLTEFAGGATLEISKSGDITKEKYNGPKAADNYTLIKDLKGDIVSDSRKLEPIERDEKGRVKQVKYADGSTRQFAYDSKGDLNRVVSPDGSVQVLKNGAWQNEKSGVAIDEKYKIGQNAKVANDGTLTYELGNSKEKIRTDGWSETQRDGATILRNSEDQVTSVKYPNGDHREFEYRGRELIGVTENGKYNRVTDTIVYGEGGKAIGLKDPNVTRDGRYLVDNAAGETLSYPPEGGKRVAKPDKSHLFFDKDDRLTYIGYPNGKSRSFQYDQNGKLNSIYSEEKSFSLKETVDKSGQKSTQFEASDGSSLKDVELKSDGTLKYQDKDGKLHSDFTNGKSSVTTRTAQELDWLSKSFHKSDWFYSNGEIAKKALADLSPADRVALDERYKKENNGVSLSQQLTLETWNPRKRDNVNDALSMLSESHLRMAVLEKLNAEDAGKANLKIDAFKAAAKDQGLTAAEIASQQERSTKELLKGGTSPELLKRLEATLFEEAPTGDSLNSKYGVNYDEKILPNGQMARQYYVEAQNGEKLPVIESKSNNPKEIEKQLKQWQEKKIKEIEGKFNLEISRDGQKLNPYGKEVNLRTPRLDELLALEQGLRDSQPSTIKINGQAIKVQFAIEPTGTADAYFQPPREGAQGSILFEPKSRSFDGLKGTILHEWAHIGQHNLEKSDPAALEKAYTDLGYRKSTVKGPFGLDQWQLKGKDGFYYSQGAGEGSFGEWTRVDEQGRALNRDGKLAESRKYWVTYSNDTMRVMAEITPPSNYFKNPEETAAESTRFFRNNAKSRGELYQLDPRSYAAIKELDQREIDLDPRYGKNPDGSSKFIRLPDARIVPNNESNSKIVNDFEKSQSEAREQTRIRDMQEQNRIHEELRRTLIEQQQVPLRPSLPNGTRNGVNGGRRK